MGPTTAQSKVFSLSKVVKRGKQEDRRKRKITLPSSF
jgi:hypothetical protein